MPIPDSNVIAGILRAQRPRYVSLRSQGGIYGPLSIPLPFLSFLRSLRLDRIPFAFSLNVRVRVCVRQYRHALCGQVIMGPSD